MTWFAFANEGHVFDLNGLAEKEMVATGAHGYATESQAIQNPNGPSTVDQQVLFVNFENAAQLPFGGASIFGVLAVDNVTAPKTPANNQKKTPQQAQKEIQSQTNAGTATASPNTGIPAGTASDVLTHGIVIIIGIFIMTFLAGINDSMGKIMTLIMGGWLLIWTITHETTFANWASKL